MSNCAEKLKRTCRLFAEGRQIVWTGAITFPKWKNGEHPLVFKYEKDIANRGFRESTGTATFDSDGTTVDLALKIRGKPCKGTADLTKGVWEMVCDSTDIRRGTIAPSSISKYWGQANDGASELLILETPGA